MRELAPYAPAQDLADNWPGWRWEVGYMPIAALLVDPYIVEMFNVKDQVITLSHICPDFELALTHAIVHLDFGHLTQQFLSDRDEDLADWLAKVRLDRPGAGEVQHVERRR